MSFNASDLTVAEGAEAGSLRLLGIFAMVAAPLLSAGQILIYAGPEGPRVNQFFTSLLAIIYLSGIGAGAVAMRRLRVTGSGRGAAVLFAVQLTGLVLATGCDVIEFAAPHLKECNLFFICDMAYPFSHVLMVVVGFAVLKTGVWKGWRAAAPFLAGLALPAFFLAMAVVGRVNSGAAFMVGTTAGFFLIGLAVTTWRRFPALPRVPLESPQPQH
jgi:hypothetical protein